MQSCKWYVKVEGLGLELLNTVERQRQKVDGGRRGTCRISSRSMM